MTPNSRVRAVLDTTVLNFIFLVFRFIRTGGVAMLRMMNAREGGMTGMEHEVSQG